MGQCAADNSENEKGQSIVGREISLNSGLSVSVEVNINIADLSVVS